MSEQGIIFTGDRPKGILEGRISQTRRAIRPQPTGEFSEPTYLHHCKENIWEWRYISKPQTCVGKLGGIKCPHGKVGDLLYVRESLEYYVEPRVNYDELRYAENHFTQVDAEIPKGYLLNLQFKWHDTLDGRLQIIPSIFMPKWAARIWLEITGIRVERVQEINENDTKAEGMLAEGTDLSNGENADDPYEQFAQLWDSINGKKYPWKDNIWIWVIEFKRTEQ